LHGVAALFSWDAWRLGKNHGQSILMSLNLGVMPCLEEDSIIVFLVFHEGIGACVDARVEYLGFEDSNPRMNI
jgi:hypothetical protein